MRVLADGVPTRVWVVSCGWMVLHASTALLREEHVIRMTRGRFLFPSIFFPEHIFIRKCGILQKKRSSIVSILQRAPLEMDQKKNGAGARFIHR